ncbi:phage major capsid protein [Sphingomonas koreensis]|uniref:Major capsid protein n=1 Tax=Sphingomonas koreensis TaxID=93064 RepID=A0A1L6J841_9SPHN|nr:phage major capsid protein [Sphingomonas koreensis]APR51996.1 major capsid protein [Sphingomonas koreensis]RSU22798.1 phage major capsid protein [Sphingomonas koreensis]RSU30728.1 phage major capsid protein [Sphingomonas koreensis]RSU31823.1 phage major capsid protein [Sphingomonas koreensis]RSU39256.1 phage major capsid protein [Sphingomonas koreensis]
MTKLIAGAALAASPALVASAADAASAAQDNMSRIREFGRKDGNQPRDEKTIERELKETLDTVKKFAEDFEKKAKAGDDATAEAKKNADEALVKLTELRGEITDLAQKFAQGRSGDREEQERKSLGQLVGEHSDLKEYVEKGAIGSVSMQIKAITSAGNSGGALITTDRRPEIIGIPRQQPRVRSLLTPGRTTSNMIEYARQTARVNNAAPVAEAAQKPESNYAWEEATAPVRTIAHWVPASRQAMDDIPQLESLIDGELRYGLDDVEDAQLLMGDNTGQNLAGLYPAATAYAAPIEIAGLTRIDQLRLAILQVELADYAPDGQILHPTDWASIELTKTVDGAYIFANPTGIAGPVLWGRPVVSTKRIGVSNFMVGAFKMAAQIFDRMETEVRISDQDRDNFIKNMLTVRAEKRLALAIRRAAAMVKGELIDLPVVP